MGPSLLRAAMNHDVIRAENVKSILEHLVGKALQNAVRFEEKGNDRMALAERREARECATVVGDMFGIFARSKSAGAVTNIDNRALTFVANLSDQELQSAIKALASSANEKPEKTALFSTEKPV